MSIDRDIKTMEAKLATTLEDAYNLQEDILLAKKTKKEINEKWNKKTDPLMKKLDKLYEKRDDAEGDEYDKIQKQIDKENDKLGKIEDKRWAELDKEGYDN